MVCHLMLFTVSACPVGRNMGTVLQEVAARHPELRVETVYVDAEPEKTNRYRVKKNPSLLLLQEGGVESMRLEGFHDTEAVERALRQIQNGEVPMQSYEENRASVETYRVFLWQGDDLVPVDVTYRNPTGVPTPRITAIQLLLQATAADAENPFPTGTALEKVQFAGEQARVDLIVPHTILLANRERMQKALEQTLSAYQVRNVEMILHERGGTR